MTFHDDCTMYVKCSVAFLVWAVKKKTHLISWENTMRIFDERFGMIEFECPLFYSSRYEFEIRSSILIEMSLRWKALLVRYQIQIHHFNCPSATIGFEMKRIPLQRLNDILAEAKPLFSTLITLHSKYGNISETQINHSCIFVADTLDAQIFFWTDIRHNVPVVVNKFPHNKAFHEAANSFNCTISYQVTDRNVWNFQSPDSLSHYSAIANNQIVFDRS